MSDTPDGQGIRRPERGEAAWKAEKESIAARNAQARKAGKQQRQANEQHAAEQRRAADRREMADLVKRSGHR
jgi:hypothetical protein